MLFLRGVTYFFTQCITNVCGTFLFNDLRVCVNGNISIGREINCYRQLGLWLRQ